MVLVQKKDPVLLSQGQAGRTFSQLSDLSFARPCTNKAAMMLGRVAISSFQMWYLSVTNVLEIGGKAMKQSGIWVRMRARHAARPRSLSPLPPLILKITPADNHRVSLLHSLCSDDDDDDDDDDALDDCPHAKMPSELCTSAR